MSGGYPFRRDELESAPPRVGVEENASSFESMGLAATSISQSARGSCRPSIFRSAVARGAAFRSLGLPTALNALADGIAIVSELTREETAEAYRTAWEEVVTLSIRSPPGAGTSHTVSVRATVVSEM